MMYCVELTVAVFILVIALLYVVKWLLSWLFQWQMLAKWNNSPKDKVILHACGRGRTIPSPSAFSLKLETYLRMAEIPYELHAMVDARGPKGKFPWITYNGEHIADSHLIIDFLNKKLGKNLSKQATIEDLGAARACRVMLEEHFFWGLYQFRVIDNISALPNIITVPRMLRPLLPILGYHSKQRLISLGGLGLHTPTEIYQMTEYDLRSASVILGNRKYFGGEEPCEEDAGIFGQVAQAVWALPGSGFERLVNDELINLKEYCERMKTLYWPDWDNCLDKRN